MVGWRGSLSLDLNRPNLESPLLENALHSATLNEKAWPTRVLLNFGARADVRDAKGRTQLDWARRRLQQFPDDAEAAEKVRLLEAAIQAQGHAAASSPAASAPP